MNQSSSFAQAEVNINIEGHARRHIQNAFMGNKHDTKIMQFTLI